MRAVVDKMQRRTKPLLRGVSHQIAAFVAAPACVALAVSARTSNARLGAITYGASLVALFLASAAFHLPTWSARTRNVLARLDNSAIFLLIAGTFTPICLLLGGGVGRGLLAGVWAAGVLGIGFSVAWPLAPKPLMAAIYVLLGWSFLATVGGLRTTLGAHGLMFLVVGGVVYTVGAAVYAVRWPDSSPNVFGYHEVFHLLVIFAAVCHFFAVRTAVEALGSCARTRSSAILGRSARSPVNLG